MANILAMGEISGGKLKKVSTEMVSAAKTLGGTVSAVLVGEGATAAAAELGKYGAEAIYTNDTKDYIPTSIAKAIADLIKEKSIDILLLPHSGSGKDIAPRVGALLDAGVISEAVEIKMDGDRVVCKKPIHSGKAIVDFKATTAVQIITVRQNSQEISENAGTGAVEALNVDAANEKYKLVSLQEKKSERVALTEADIVVSGGRGLKDAAGFKMIEDLADLLDAGTGATRAIVDAGWVDHTLQIGQTGQTVSPNLYFAIGISGAIQHLAGMGSSKFIVAVNKDADAPIFKVSTFGIVDDLFKVMPVLTEEVKAIKG